MTGKSRSHALFPLQLAAACTPLVLPQVEALGAALFRELPLIVHRKLVPTALQWAANMRLEQPAARNIIEVDDMFAVARAAERGVGVALLPTITAASWFASGALTRAFCSEVTTGESYYLAYREEDIRRDEVRALRDWALNEFQQA